MTEELLEILNNNKNIGIDKVFNIKFLHIIEGEINIDITHLLKTCIENNIYFLKFHNHYYQKIIHIQKNDKDYYFMRVIWSEYGVLREHKEMRKSKIIECS